MKNVKLESARMVGILVFLGMGCFFDRHMVTKSQGLIERVWRQRNGLGPSEGDGLEGSAVELEELVRSGGPKGGHSLAIDFGGSSKMGIIDVLRQGDYQGENYTLFVPFRPERIALPVTFYPKATLSKVKIVDAKGNEITSEERECGRGLPEKCACDRIWVSETPQGLRLRVIPGKDLEAVCFWNLHSEER
jgi:hypothetical protein